MRGPRGQSRTQSRTSDPGLFRAFGGRVVVGTLPVAQFANGHVFYAQRTHSRLGLAPYAVHNTFQYGGSRGKRHRMREANAWLGDALASSRGGGGGKRDERSEEEEAPTEAPAGRITSPVGTHVRPRDTARRGPGAVPRAIAPRREG